LTRIAERGCFAEHGNREYRRHGGEERNDDGGGRRTEDEDGAIKANEGHAAHQNALIDGLKSDLAWRVKTEPTETQEQIGRKKKRSGPDADQRRCLDGCQPATAKQQRVNGPHGGGDGQRADACGVGRTLDGRGGEQTDKAGDDRPIAKPAHPSLRLAQESPRKHAREHRHQGRRDRGRLSRRGEFQTQRDEKSEGHAPEKREYQTLAPGGDRQT
jgi:hypothetical protein